MKFVTVIFVVNCVNSKMSDHMKSVYLKRWDDQGEKVYKILNNSKQSAKFSKLINKNRDINWVDLESYCTQITTVRPDPTESFNECIGHLVHWTTTADFNDATDVNKLMISYWNENRYSQLKNFSFWKGEKLNSSKFKALIAALAATQLRVLVTTHDSNGDGKLEDLDQKNELDQYEKWMKRQRRRFWSFKQLVSQPSVQGYLDNVWTTNQINTKIDVKEIVKNAVDILNLWNEIIRVENQFN